MKETKIDTYQKDTSYLIVIVLFILLSIIISSCAL